MDQQTAIEVLLSCLHTDADETKAARLGGLSAADWKAIIQLSARHKVAPLLYYRLHTLGLDASVPADVTQTLRGLYLENAGRNMRLYHILGELLQSLRDDDIPVIVLKGAYLAGVVYGNAALRPMNDVDLMVRRADLSRVMEKLQKIGYASSLQPGVKPAWNQRTLCFSKPGSAFIHIHLTITPPASYFRIDIDGLWQRARPATIAGIDALVLSPEDLLLHLCLHVSSQHVFNVHLAALYDLLETLRHYQDDIDWEQVTLRARQWKTDNSVYLTLYLVCEWLGVSIPAGALDALRPDDFEPRLLTAAREQFLAYKSGTSPALDHPRLIRLWGSKRLQDKVTYFLKMVFPSPEAMSQMYPVPPDSLRIYLYYPVRLKDLLLRLGRSTWSWRLLGDKETMAMSEREYVLRDWLMWR